MLVRRNFHVASGMKTTMTNADQPSASHMLLPGELPLNKFRQASTVTLTGLCSAKPCSQLGMVPTGTKAELANVKGKSQINPPDCAASTEETLNPMSTAIQEKAKPNTKIRPMPARL